MGFLGSWEDILAMKFFEGFPKVKDYISSKAFWLPLIVSHILNLSPFLEFCPFHFEAFILIFFGPCFLIVLS